VFSGSYHYETEKYIKHFSGTYFVRDEEEEIIEISDDDNDADSIDSKEKKEFVRVYSSNRMTYAMVCFHFDTRFENEPLHPAHNCFFNVRNQSLIVLILRKRRRTLTMTVQRSKQRHRKLL
jgi:hypothetical protein